MRLSTTNCITDKERECFELWSTLLAKAKKFCLRNRAGLERYDLGEVHVVKMGCLWCKKTEDEQVDKTKSPLIYTKIKANPKMGKCYANFHKGQIRRGEDPKLELQDILGKRSDLRAVLHFQSIFINSTYVTLQVKVLKGGHLA